jgi:hypothetical protein
MLKIIHKIKFLFNNRQKFYYKKLEVNFRKVNKITQNSLKIQCKNKPNQQRKEEESQNKISHKSKKLNKKPKK